MIGGSVVVDRLSIITTSEPNKNITSIKIWL